MSHSQRALKFVAADMALSSGAWFISRDDNYEQDASPALTKIRPRRGNPENYRRELG